MRIVSVAPIAAAAFAAFGATGSAAFADADHKISGPHVHENLAIYFIHGAGAAGPVPLTLSEALAKGRVQVIETGRVNELQIENTGEEEVFVQAGDIVKGGKQDRVLTVSLVLPPRSGVVPIAAFCVEQGRWSARGTEDHAKFTSASEAMPSRRALAVMAAPPSAEPPAHIRPAGGSLPRGADTASRQQQVWESVAKVQADLSGRLNARVAAPQSATSLQLSLENADLKAARQAYVAALERHGLDAEDVLGYVVAINGKAVSANVYPSNALFRKMWSKQLAAAVTEAIGERSDSVPAEAPSMASARDFLTAAEQGKAQERETAFSLRQETRDSDEALYNETRSASGRWLHKTYVRK
jgi:hypothetical protein